LNNLPIYNTEQTAEEIKTQFLFESVGEKTIIKIKSYNKGESFVIVREHVQDEGHGKERQMRSLP